MYLRTMGGLDTVIFTGGVGQGSAVVRALATRIACAQGGTAIAPRASRLRLSSSVIPMHSSPCNARGTNDGTRSFARFIADTPGCILESATGSVQIDRGVICALRHIHMNPEDALRYGVRDKSFVRVRIVGDRELIFGDVLVRVDPSFKLAMHIDTDEGNAANVKTGAQGYVDGIQSEGYQSS